MRLLVYLSLFQNASDRYLGEVFFDISLFVHCVSLMALTSQGLCSAFISAVWVAFPLLTKFCTRKDFKQHGRVYWVFMQIGKYLKMNRTGLAGIGFFLVFWARVSRFLLCCVLVFLFVFFKFSDHTDFYFLPYTPSHSHIYECMLMYYLRSISFLLVFLRP